VAQDLRRSGWKKARALVGGWKAWIDAGLPTEPKQDLALQQK
jgi:3-mercaptopyruvate sulfurtransferase SseA